MDAPARLESVREVSGSSGSEQLDDKAIDRGLDTEVRLIGVALGVGDIHVVLPPKTSMRMRLTTAGAESNG